jgi:hypothetical protein
MRINPHPLPDTALNISPFLSSPFHSTPHSLLTFSFSVAQIIYETHVAPLLRQRPDEQTLMLLIIGMQRRSGWKLLLLIAGQ